MKFLRSNLKNRAMTLLEVLMIIFVLLVLAAMLLPGGTSRNKAQRINCINNLKEISLSYQLWAADHGDQYPMEISVTNGGTRELAEAGNAIATFQMMSNELSTPKILFCTAEADGTYATNFSTGLNRKNVSYFVGLDAAKTLPSALLAGDDNFEISGVSVKSGFQAISTNTPVVWSGARHKFAGNIGLADGSVQQLTKYGLQETLQQTSLPTNRLVIP
jgi:prepilin-type processing-associated H-X9-DG protein